MRNTVKTIHVNATFRFHKVGQGLFYSGVLNQKNKNSHSTFSFVYDCGTASNISFLKKEIDDFKLLLQTARSSGHKKLDMLVVSHLHDDHVNGLNYLLKDMEVDTVVMPYTDALVNIISYGINNRYGHPDKEILLQMPNIVCVNERKSFDYQIML